MNKSLYKIIAWVMIIIGIIYTFLFFYSHLKDIFYLIYYNFGESASVILSEVLYGLLIPAFIFTLSFFPAKYYLKVGNKEANQNKLTDISLILTMVGIALIVLVSFAVLVFFVIGIPCPPSAKICYGFGLLYLIACGICTAAFLYAIAAILLLADKFRN